MVAMTSVGAQHRCRKAGGWNRQLRLTPLSTRAYMRAKVLTGYLTACVTLVLLFIAGSTLGVHLAAKDVLHMTELGDRRPDSVCRTGNFGRPPLHARFDRPSSSVAAYRSWRCSAGLAARSAVTTGVAQHLASDADVLVGAAAAPWSARQSGGTQGWIIVATGRSCSARSLHGHSGAIPSAFEPTTAMSRRHQ